MRQFFPAICQTGEVGTLLLSLREPCRPPGVLLIILSTGFSQKEY